MLRLEVYKGDIILAMGNNCVIKRLLSCFRSNNLGEVEELRVGGNNVYTYPRMISSSSKCYIDQIFTSKYNEKDIINLAKLNYQEVYDIIKKNRADSASFYGIGNEEEFLQNIEKIPIVKKYYSCCLEKDEFQKYLTNRNVRKAQNECSIVCVESKSVIYKILQMGNMKIQWKDMKDMVCQQTELILGLIQEEKAIVYCAIRDNVIIGGIISIILNKRIYMLLHNYLPEYCMYRFNDYLYHQLIQYAIDGNIDIINWGEVESWDEGLKRFKKKYSSSIVERKSLHLFWHI